MNTHPRPVLSERQRTLLASYELEAYPTDFTIIILHPDNTISRVDVDRLDTWLDGYSHGRGYAE